MKKILLSSVFLLLATAPVNASPRAEVCLNEVIETKLTEFQHPNTKAKLATSIQHQGKEYHWIDLSLGRSILRSSELIISTDDQGSCSIVTWIIGSYATKAEYDAALGKEVNEEFIKAFKSQR